MAVCICRIHGPSRKRHCARTRSRQSRPRLAAPPTCSARGRPAQGDAHVQHCDPPPAPRIHPHLQKRALEVLPIHAQRHEHAHEATHEGPVDRLRAPLRADQLRSRMRVRPHAETQIRMRTAGIRLRAILQLEIHIDIRAHSDTHNPTYGNSHRQARTHRQQPSDGPSRQLSVAPSQEVAPKDGDPHVAAPRAHEGKGEGGGG